MEALDTLSMAPPGSLSLATQVGGHGGVMSDASGSIVMKPATTREIAFYQLLSSAPNPARPTSFTGNQPQDQQAKTAKYDRLSQRQLLGELKRFLPRFYGTLRLEGQVGKEGGVTPVGETPESIVLQNLSAPYIRPCILDIKLGTVLYDRDASDEKKARMEKRAKEGTSFKTGVRMTGFQNWDPVKQEMIVTDKAYGYALTVDKLPEGFAKFFPLPGQTGKEGTGRTVQAGGVEPAVREGEVSIEAGSSTTSPGSTNSTPKQAGFTSSSKEAYRQSLVRVLEALHQSVSDLYALLDRLEIRFVGASLLIVYEGEPEALAAAWKIVDEEGRGRGDGLDEFGPDLSGDETDPASEDEQEDATRSAMVVDGEPVGKVSKPGFFSGLIGGFGAEKKDGSTGFGLLDKSPPRRRVSGQPAVPMADTERAESDDDEQEHEVDEEEDEHRPRPFTARIIDFAHTRLVHGEGKDEGFLKGLKTVLDLIQGRLDELKQTQ